jgi:hydroxymethylpyrimidine pyrophosphatase-like HAD family hydrolase
VHAGPTYRAVVTDLDGTIIRRDGTVSPAALAATTELTRRGIAVVAATGRPPAGLDAVPALAELLALAVCSGGAVGWSPARREMLWRHTIDATTVDQLVRFTVESLPEAGILAYDGRGWRMTPSYGVLGVIPRRGPVEMVATEALTGPEFCLISVRHPDLSSDDLCAAYRTAGIDPAPTMTPSTPYLLDISAPGVDKAAGVRTALAMLGVAPQDAVAFGDMPNDLPLFALCGHSVALANGHPDVLAAAASVTWCVEHDGMPHYLRSLGLIDLGHDPWSGAGCDSCASAGQINGSPL